MPIVYLSQNMRLCYLSHRRPAKTQASLRIRAVSPEPSLTQASLRIRPVSPEPSLVAHSNMEVDKGSD